MANGIDFDRIIKSVRNIHAAIIGSTNAEDWVQEGDRILLNEKGFEKIVWLFSIAYDITQSNGIYYGRFALKGSDSSVEVEAPTKIEVINRGMERLLPGFRLLTPAQTHSTDSTTC